MTPHTKAHTLTHKYVEHMRTLPLSHPDGWCPSPSESGGETESEEESSEGLSKISEEEGEKLSTVEEEEVQEGEPGLS